MVSNLGHLFKLQNSRQRKATRKMSWRPSSKIGSIFRFDCCCFFVSDCVATRVAPRLRRNTRSTRSREDEEVNETRQIPQQLWIHLQSFVAFRAGSRKNKQTRRLRSTLIEKLDRESKSRIHFQLPDCRVSTRAGYRQSSIGDSQRIDRVELDASLNTEMSWRADAYLWDRRRRQPGRPTPAWREWPYISTSTTRANWDFCVGSDGGWPGWRDSIAAGLRTSSDACRTASNTCRTTSFPHIISF